MKDLPVVFQAITTTYYGPTNYMGARIKAECQCKVKFYSYPNDARGGTENAHYIVAQQFAEDLDWAPCRLVGGGIKKGYVWVIDPEWKAGEEA